MSRHRVELKGYDEPAVVPIVAVVSRAVQVAPSYLSALEQDNGQMFVGSLDDRPFRVLAVNQWEDPDHVFSYMGELAVFPSFPILFDRTSVVSEHYGVRGLPTSFIVDPEGRLVYRAIGGREFDHPDVTGLIDSLLEDK